MIGPLLSAKVGWRQTWNHSIKGALGGPNDQMERYIPMACESTDRRRLSWLRRFKKMGFFRAVTWSSQLGVNRPNCTLQYPNRSLAVNSYSLIRAVDAGLVPPLTYFVPQLSLKLYF